MSKQTYPNFRILNYNKINKKWKITTICEVIIIKMIYLDNAATSFPKAIDTMRIQEIIDRTPGSINRRGYSSDYNLSSILDESRRKIKTFIGSGFEDKLIFTFNATHAINMALRGILNKNDHVLTTRYEHSAISRTLYSLTHERNISYSLLNVNTNTSEEEFEELLLNLLSPNSKMIVMTYGSNVTGDIIYKSKFGEIAHKYGLIVFVDASQAVGNIEINVKRENIDIMAFSGHKSLMGLTGTGFLYFRNNMNLPLIFTGGTGIKSEDDFIIPTEELDYEVGTMNIPGILSINQSIHFLEQNFKEVITKKSMLTKEIIKRLKAIDGIHIYGNFEAENHLPIISFNAKNLHPVNEVAIILENVYNIVTRAGIHCAPWTHKMLGTFPQGTVRISPGYFNEMEDIYTLEKALKEISLIKQI
ncbi:aminotransferase class V-fold PLP-dependent enzyme [Lysinibacillus telephonicus]|uniref:Aminotransferase class V-fold PLP-dependent enzyme n=1 Tax=Lysinibacillus telephonicus TaxID=1714840 RepID=A0A431UUL5_9BACI|nr:aminotransferase class V-fold PLP-dependent enzyme [Lysinibacillus telephonicus]RTQ94326.1 aminotransferase class V-fold PLP-dependent enzyme [Lysinibacillus telephonicus]